MVCVYCGLTLKVLYTMNPNANTDSELICSCCGHCLECKLLMKQHKTNQILESINENHKWTYEDEYNYMTNWKDKGKTKK